MKTAIVFVAIILFGLIVFGAAGHHLTYYCEAYKNAAAPHPEMEQWLQKFVCEIKATDMVIAFFTYCLVVVGVFQALRSDQSLKMLERAYLFPAWQDLITSDPQRLGVTFRIRNVGRSSAVLKEFVIKFDQSTLLPRRPDYSGAQHIEFDWGIEPQATKDQAVTVNSNNTGEQFAFGYIRYDNVFQKSRISRFGIRFFPDRVDRRGEAAGGEPYNSYT